MKENYKRLNLLFSLVTVLSLCGCGGSNASTSTSSGSDSISSEEPISYAEDTIASTFSLNYYPDSENKNHADGLVTIDRKQGQSINYNSISLNWGDDVGYFEDYNPLTTITNLKSTSLEYTIPQNSFIPIKATKLWVLAKNSNNEVVDKGSIGFEIYKEKLTLQYEFQVISDTQLSVGSPEYTRKAKKTFEDIKTQSPNTKAICVNGDIIDEYSAGNYDLFYRTYNEVYPNNSANMMVGIGNHEFIIQSETDYATASESIQQERYNTRVSLWKQKTGNDSVYFYNIVEGDYYIFLGTTEMPHNLDGNTRCDATLGEEQLNWLKEKVEEASKNGKKAYIMSHGSLRNTVSGSLKELNQTWYGYSEQEDKAINEIIKGYKNVFFFSSHSHWSFESEKPYIINEDGPSFFNTAAIGYLWEGHGDGRIYKNKGYENSGAQGLYVEVYDKAVVIKGRQFEDIDKTTYWFSGYQAIVSTK